MSITEILSNYLRYGKWIALSVALCLGTGFVFLQSEDMEYEVSLCAILNKETSFPAAADTQQETPDIRTTDGNLENETVIIRSPGLMAQVVETLHLETDYYVKNLLGRKDHLFSEAPYNVVFTQDNKDELRKMELTIRRNNFIYIVDGKYSGISETVDFQEELRELPGVIPLPGNAGTLTVLATGKTVPPVCFVDIDRTENVANALAAATKVEPTSNASSILKIDLRINNPEKGAAVLEELVRRYNANAGEEKKKRALALSTFIGERLKEISLELDMTENDMAEYRQANNIDNLTPDTERFTLQTDEYERQRTDAETQLRIVGMVDRFVREHPLSEPVPNPGVRNPELAQAIADYNTHVAAYARLIKNTIADNPARLKPEANLTVIHNRIVGLIRTEKEAIRNSLADTGRQGVATGTPIRDVPQRESILLEKERQQKIIENVFLYLIRKREETHVAMAADTEKATVVVAPDEGEKVYPADRKTLTVFTLLGLMLPVALIVLADVCRTAVGSIFELRRIAGAGIIGEIGHDANPVAVRDNPSSRTAEQFRMMRNNIDRHFAHEGHKLLLVTSYMRGEGKTFVGINLATAFAMLGKRVLLVDADLRRAGLNGYMMSQSEYGLADFLAGHVAAWERFVECLPGVTTLHILTAGALPPNPNELLMGSRFKRFVDEARAAYDCVILDASPAGFTSDALVAAELADMTLFVVRERMTPRAALSSAGGGKYLQMNNLHLVYNAMTTLPAGRA
ncbi:MAG: polysaccharide biosynthesis tyrosine autokinase [Tannerella sp.]|nr:polysaccharide biosynthesis tyrosine autokinase [Tannerella sp.]